MKGGAADGFVLDDQIGHLLRRAYQRAAANLVRRIAAHGVTPVQFAVLARLREHGAVSQNELGRLAAIDAPTTHGIVGRLLRGGLIEAAAVPGDRRRRQLSLTAAGRDLVDALIPAAQAGMEETLAPLSGEERRGLVEYLRRLG